MAVNNQQLRQSRAEKLLKKRAGSLKKPTLLISAIVYLALIGVVIYGAHNHVYDGFGAAAPWIVGSIFALMVIFRSIEFIRSINRCKEVRRYLEKREQQKSVEPDS